MKIGIAADHGGFDMKEYLRGALEEDGHEVVDFGALAFEDGDDYPDFAVPLAREVARGTLERGVAVCGSGVGVCVAANKVPGARACLIHDSFCAHQGVEDDDLNILCLGSRVVGFSQALELTRIFLGARFSGAERHRRRVSKVCGLDEARRESVKGG